MEPCPNCGQQVLQAAKSCRHCGHELDEATFFLNEGEMVAEIMALQKEAQEKEEKVASLGKKVKGLGGLSGALLVGGGLLVGLADHTALEALGALSCVGGVVSTFMTVKSRKQLAALDE